MQGRLAPYKRVVVKIGSALLVDRKSGLKSAWLKSLAHDIADLRATGHEVLVVSSGAIAMGRTVLDLPSGSLKLEENQAAAAVGQIALARAWDEALGAREITTGQVLVTINDTESRRRYLNARATIGALLRMGAVPVINENDTVATNEIRYGDNDRLAARVATMMNADLLVILSDVDGLYTASPALDPDARHFAEVPAITPQIEAMAGEAASELSRGGMRTKVEAGKIATQAGTAMIITKGTVDHPLKSPSTRAPPRRCFMPPPARFRHGRAGSPASWSHRGGSSLMQALTPRCSRARACLPLASSGSKALSSAATRSRSYWKMTARRSRAAWQAMIPARRSALPAARRRRLKTYSVMRRAPPWCTAMTWS
jgi:glutamate 5-kinase